MLALVGGASAVAVTALADETSTHDKLRILYSNRFTFDDRGIPRITVEIMSHRDRVTLSARGGLRLLPDGEGGAHIDSGERWTVTVDNPKPAVIREWTVVERLGADDGVGADNAVRRWRQRGYRPKRFEVGTIFGVEGEVIDSRTVLIAVAPVARPGGRAKARTIASRYNVETSIHPEMVRRPRGTIVARSGSTVVRNPSVMWFRPRSPDTTITVDDVTAVRGGSQLETRRESRRYWGSIYLTLGSDGGLVAVNSVSADKLLAGLVPSEIFATAHRQALAAQAIAARTELLEKIGSRHLTDPYLLCSSQHCQVYSGAGREHPRTTQAVHKTRGQILLRNGGGLVDARYSASCGGHGEDNDHVWGDAADPSLRGRVDAPAGSVLASRYRRITDKNIGDFIRQPPTTSYCGQTRYGKGRTRWQRRLDVTALSKRIAAHYPGVGTVRALEPMARGISGRASKLRIRGSGRTLVVSGDLHIRRLLGGLRSTLFTVQTIGPDNAPTAFDVRGAGFGHGVGMCQTGAIGRAESGQSFGAILQHYYPGSNLKRLY